MEITVKGTANQIITDSIKYDVAIARMTLSFSKIEGRHGTYALIDKGENRDREIRKPRPSIRAQLKADKAKTAPKKAAAKTKNHDMEV